MGLVLVLCWAITIVSFVVYFTNKLLFIGRGSINKGYPIGAVLARIWKIWGEKGNFVGYHFPSFSYRIVSQENQQFKYKRKTLKYCQENLLTLRWIVISAVLFFLGPMFLMASIYHTCFTIRVLLYVCYYTFYTNFASDVSIWYRRKIYKTFECLYQPELAIFI